MLTIEDRDRARERTLAFFRSVHLGVVREHPAVERRFSSSDEARDAQYTATPGMGGSFLDLKQTALSVYDLAMDVMSRADVAALRELADNVARDCVMVVTAPDDGRFDEWFDDLEGDALGVFYAECFPHATDQQATDAHRRDPSSFFALIKAGYEAGGVPCAVPGWPAPRIAIFTG